MLELVVPTFDATECEREVAIRRPQVKVRLLCCDILDGKHEDLLLVHE
jgi:hypothetical protein